MPHKEKLRISHTQNSISSEWLSIGLVLLSLAALALGVWRLAVYNDLYAYILLLAFIVLVLAGLYCAAYFIRVIFITGQRFILGRPYARYWIKPLKTELINLPLADINGVLIHKTEDGEGEEKETWKITLKNRSSVTFLYKADKDDLQEAIKELLACGITIQTMKGR